LDEGFCLYESGIKKEKKEKKKNEKWDCLDIGNVSEKWDCLDIKNMREKWYKNLQLIDLI